MGGTKPGRNEPCPCGSGKKFKRCHGGPNADYEEMISRGAEEAQRRAEIHWIQQQRQQGLGRPIIAAQTAGKRIVAVGHRLFQGAWPTFHDFLYSYIFDVLGRDWFEAQTQLEQNEHHPVIQWHERLLAASKAANPAPGETRQTPMTGAISAFLTLAYDLYTLEHNNDQTRTPELRKSLIGRLKSQDQFIGVRYEIRVAAMLLRAGFELEWEDETDRRSKHVEYTATYPRTGKAFGVECKIRNQDAAKKANQHLGKFAGLVSDALRKTRNVKPTQRLRAQRFVSLPMKSTSTALPWWASIRRRAAPRLPNWRAARPGSCPPKPGISQPRGGTGRSCRIAAWST